MGVPNVYRKSSAAIATYSYTDIAAATGIQIYYLAKTVDLTVLTPNAIYSNTVMTSSTQNYTDGTFKLLHDVDFDITFNLAQTTRGTAIVNIPIGILGVTAVKTYSAYVILKARHWDGSTETDLASNQSDTIQFTTSGVNEYKYAMFAVDLDLTTPKLFKKGDTLRLTVEYYAKNHNAASQGEFFFGHDPKNRATTDQDDETFGDEPSIAEFHVPFKIDI